MDSAIGLIKKVIANKDKNRIENNEYIQFDQYEKATVSITKLDSASQNQKVFDKFKFIFNYLDTSDVGNHQLLTISVRESLSNEYRRKTRNSRKSVITAIRHEGLDKKIRSDFTESLFVEAVKQVDITDNEINFLFRRFISPISSTRALSFYKYHIVDTVDYNNHPCVNLAFIPNNTQDMGFSGNLWISLDSTCSIRKVVLRTLHEINLNFVSQMTITQEFDSLPNGQMAKIKETSAIEFSLFKIYYGLYAKNERVYSHYLINEIAPVVFGLNDEITFTSDAESQPDSIWDVNRPFPLKKGEKTVWEISSQIEKVPYYRTWVQITDILVSNYTYTGRLKQASKFDIGPIWSTLSRNDVEGFRIRLGGRTTANLNDQLFFLGYGAYGTKDKKFVYSGTIVYSFYPKKYYENEYRKNNLGFVFKYDIHTPGQQYYFTDPDNIFLSFKRGQNDKMTYIRKFELQYEKEFTSGFYWKFWGKSWVEEAAGSLHFLKSKDGYTVDVEDYKAAELGVMLRFAMNEKFHQGRDTRLILRRDGPVFTLSQSFGMKGFLGDYSYYFVELSAQKRFWLSGYGHLNLIAKTGKLWGNVPFPLLILPNANQTYTIQPESYSMMNTLEFINDSYASIDLAYYMDGWLFNRIPFIRKYKLREVFSFKGLVGDLRNGNNPQINNNLFLFPENSYTMTNTPYMEVSVGIENIFKLLRVDYVRRLTYLSNAGIDKNGIRVTINLTF